MSYGFEVKGPTGNVIVDAVSQRFGMPSTGSMTADVNGYAQVPSGFAPFPLIQLGLNKGLAFVPIGPFAGRYRFLNVSGTDFSVAGSETRSIGSMQPYSLIASPVGYGIEIRNEQGQITFNSAAPLVSFRNAFSLINPSNIQNLTIASDVTHIFFVCTWAFIQGNPSGGLIHCPVVLRNSATNLHIKSGVVHNSGPPADYYNSDVTFHILTARVIL